MIAIRLDESVDYLIRGSESEALVGQERELFKDFRKLSEEAKEVVIKNVRLLLRS